MHFHLDKGLKAKESGKLEGQELCLALLSLWGLGTKNVLGTDAQKGLNDPPARSVCS